MDRLAGEMDQIMARMQAVDESDNVYGGCGPRLNEESGSVRVARQAGRAGGQARQREAAGRDHRLRRARPAVAEELSGLSRSALSRLVKTGQDAPGARPAASCRGCGDRETFDAIGGAMALELKISPSGSAPRRYIHETDLVLAEQGFNILLGTTLVGQDHVDEADGRHRQADLGRGLVQGRERDRHAGAEAQRLDGLSAVHQLPEPHGLREHRLAVAGRRVPKARDRRAGRPGRRADAHHADARAHAERAFRRPAAAHRDRPGAGQGRRSRAARRAARQSRLQAARGAARRAAQAVRRP